MSPFRPYREDERPATMPVVPKRFDRNARLWGVRGVDRLARSHVMVLGLGGVGSFTVEGLVRSGVGRLTLVDFDDVCVTNVNRQLPALPATVGRSKAELMAERAKAINPQVHVEPVKAFYEAKTAAALLGRAPDVIIDCIDNVTAKLHLLASCIYHRLPCVTSLGASGKVDPTRVRATDLRKTHDDPLAKMIRKYLWRVYEINLKRVSNVNAVFSDEKPLRPDPEYTGSPCGGSECVCPNRLNQHHTCSARHIIWGSSVLVTSTFGMTAASLAVRYLAGDDTVCLKPEVKVFNGDEPLVDPDSRWENGVLKQPQTFSGATESTEEE